MVYLLQRSFFYPVEQSTYLKFHMRKFVKDLIFAR